MIISLTALRWGMPLKNNKIDGTLLESCCINVVTYTIVFIQLPIVNILRIIFTLHVHECFLNDLRIVANIQVAQKDLIFKKIVSYHF